MVTLLPLKKRDAPLHILNFYCSPKLKNISFATLFSRGLKAVSRDPLVVMGDFNAHSTLWEYVHDEKRGCKLAEPASTLSFTLHTDPAYLRRVGSSVTRDTCPDLTFTKNVRHANWANTKETLGSDLRILITTTLLARLTRKPAYLTGQSSEKTTPIWPRFTKQVTTRGHENRLPTFL
ncbi:hypothetical protein HPB51_005013 [Rhipicephalus microplus]|uniref:Endonuclease/exonuclease/phosphatase domain-containing protein n=1 Tax=Rhipicephalus microplus TaxID=6941 RepID=A0A9J6EXH5_RHIMP|nr:hypothetical protein HPB51_005013 [Rhipicephalus microplus]